MYAVNVVLNLGPNYAGKSLVVQLIDQNGQNQGSPITTGFVELGSGSYLWKYDSVPDGFIGAGKVYENGFPNTTLVAFSVDPPIAGAVTGIATETTIVYAN